MEIFSILFPRGATRTVPLTPKVEEFALTDRYIV
jgi:hypothetical protein